MEVEIIIAVLLMLLAGNTFLVFMISKKVKELKEIRETDATQGVDTRTPVAFEERKLQVEALKCRIIVLKQFVEAQDKVSLQKYLISRFCNEDLYDFFMKNTDFIHFKLSENLYSDEAYFDVKLDIVKPTSTDNVSFWE